MSKLNEMLGSGAGRKALLDSIPNLFLHDEKSRQSPPVFEEVPIDRIAWCAGHRLNTLPLSVVDNLKNPVNLNRVSINGEVLYLVHDGNHRIERFVEAGREMIPAEVYGWDLAPAVLKKGFGTEYSLDRGKGNGDGAMALSGPRNITKEQAEVFKALGVVRDETVLAPVPAKKRRIFGFGIGD